MKALFIILGSVLTVMCLLLTIVNPLALVGVAFGVFLIVYGKKYKKPVTPIPYGIYIPEQESDTNINWKGLPKYCNIFKDRIKQRRMTAVQHQMSLELRIDAVKYKKA